jgi:hypothetical protein
MLYPSIPERQLEGLKLLLCLPTHLVRNKRLGINLAERKAEIGF